MNPFAVRRIGKTDVRVTVLGLGGTAYAGMYQAVSDSDASNAISEAYSTGIRYFDTAPLYGHGSSERRLGAALHSYARESYVISTKVGRVMESAPLASIEPDVFAEPLPYRPVFDFTASGIARSFRESLERLKAEFVDVCLVHDPDQSGPIIHLDPHHEAHFEQVMRDSWPALDELRQQGLIRATGVGMNQWPMLHDFVQTGKFDCILLAGRYTLLDQTSLETLLPACLKNDVSVIIGGPYNSGILATGPVAGATYDYSAAPPEILDRVSRLQSVCEDFDVELRAAALQFPLAHPAVASIIPGARSSAEVIENVRLLSLPIPSGFWAELKRSQLISANSPTPD
jgi:D-threo-aldose 1-dehydrogenase